MKHLKLAWMPILITAVLLGGCGNDSPEESTGDTDSEEQTDEHLDANMEDEVNRPEYDVVVDGEEKVSPYNQEQWDLYDGGDVSREAYEEAFLNFVACVEDNDGWIGYASLDDETINYSMTAGSDPDDFCYVTHFELVDGDWQTSHPPDESGAIQADIDCLKDNDIEPSHEEPVSEPGRPQQEQILDLWQQLEEHDLTCDEYTDPAYDDIPYDD